MKRFYREVTGVPPWWPRVDNNNRVGGARKLWRFRLGPDGGVVAGSRTSVYDWLDGRGPDGVTMDSLGRLFVTGGLNRSNPPYESAERFKGSVYVLSVI